MKLDKDSAKKYFSILKLKPDADLDELKLAYRKRVKAWHPDKFPSSSERLQKMAHDKLHKVNVAYKHLKKYIEEESGKTAGDKTGRRKTDKGFTKESRSASTGPDGKAPPHEPPPPPPGFYDRKDRWEAEAPRKPGVQEPQPKVSTHDDFHRLPNGDKYAGEIVNNKPHGEGVYIFAGGNQYAGEFKNGKPHGIGKFTFSTGDKYEGQFKEDAMEGQGIYFYANGDKYMGQFKGGQPHGEGVYISAGGKQSRGLWENGFLKTEM